MKERNMNDTSAENQRRLKRHSLSASVEVFDVSRGLCLGRLVNIHEEGLMMMGEVSIDADHVYQFEIQPPDGDPIQIGVDCLWARQSEESTMCWSGYQIISISDTARQQIQQLISQLAD
jgi:hypothetical protein